MRKRIRIAGMILIMSIFSMQVFAEEKMPTVEFTEQNELVYQNAVNESEGIVDLGSAFNHMAPGETKSLTIKLVNRNSHKTNFYMHTEALQTLEEKREAMGGVYYVALQLGDKEIYHSEVGGTKVTNEAYQKSREGLLELNKGALQKQIFLKTLAKDESENLTVTIGLEGETMRNSYQLAEGRMGITFAVTYETPSTNVEEETEIIKGPMQEKILQRITELTKVVKTGDGTPIFGTVLVLCIGVILLFATRGKKQRNQLLLGMISLGMLFAPFHVRAAEAGSERTYLVTYLAGKTGTFNEEYQEEMKESGAIVSNTKIEVRVLANGEADYPRLPENEDMNLQEDYYVLAADEWGPTSGKVTRSCEFVVQYGKIVRDIDSEENKKAVYPSAERLQNQQADMVVAACRGGIGYLVNKYIFRE